MKTHSMNIYKSIAFICLLIISGCATVQNSAFDNSTKSLDFSQNSYFVMGIEIDHAVKPKYLPNAPLIMHVEKPEAKSKEERFNILVKPEEFLNKPGRPVFAYFRGALIPGDYIIKGVTGTATKFPIVGSMYLPLELSFTLDKNEVLYMGTVRARTRSRREGEFRSGPVIPLLDQAVSGYAGSTFEVAIEDQSEQVTNWINEAAPVLSTTEVTARLLPKYDRSAFDQEGTVTSSEPVFKAPDEPVDSTILGGLRSNDPHAMRTSAIAVGKQHLYTDSTIIDGTIHVLETALTGEQNIKDKYYIDGLAWCALNLGNSGDARSIEILTRVVESSLPKKVKSNASRGLKKAKSQ